MEFEGSNILLISPNKEIIMLKKENNKIILTKKLLKNICSSRMLACIEIFVNPIQFHPKDDKNQQHPSKTQNSKHNKNPTTREKRGLPYSHYKPSSSPTKLFTLSRSVTSTYKTNSYMATYP
jgi:DNA mismatch repair ATPase MutL